MLNLVSINKHEKLECMRGMYVLSTRGSRTVRILRTDCMRGMCVLPSTEVYLGVGYEIGRAVHMNEDIFISTSE